MLDFGQAECDQDGQRRGDGEQHERRIRPDHADQPGAPEQRQDRAQPLYRMAHADTGADLDAMLNRICQGRQHKNGIGQPPQHPRRQNHHRPLPEAIQRGGYRRADRRDNAHPPHADGMGQPGQQAIGEHAHEPVGRQHDTHPRQGQPERLGIDRQHRIEQRIAQQRQRHDRR